MSIRSVLVTGGAGFIGSHVADELLAQGYRVRALDNLTPQVHGEARTRPTYLAPEVELVVGDVRDGVAVERALEGIDAVFHLAAAVGVGQSMYEVERYNSVNVVGTSVLMERLAKRPVRRLVVASSMSIYGEGLYVDETGRERVAMTRELEQLRKGRWEVTDGHGQELRPIPTRENKAVSLESVYALSKFDQERQCLLLGRAYGIPTVALRLFNVYGSRQSISSPYTGALASFASRLLNGQHPILFEDGRQRRDFVSVHDVARACRLAMEVERAAGMTFNIGSGESRTVAEIARAMAVAMRVPRLEAELTGRYRLGDIRHCFADISLARRVLRYAPEVPVERGLRELADWLREQRPLDAVRHGRAELEARGLSV